MVMRTNRDWADMLAAVAAWVWRRVIVPYLTAQQWVIDVVTSAWAWWREAFGVSDTLDRPDASTLAARAAGHWAVGAMSVIIVHSLTNVPTWAILAMLASLYAAWEYLQLVRDPARHLRRVARRWDMAVDWVSVQLGGLTTAVTLEQMSMAAVAFASTSVALILISAAVMGDRR